MDILGILTDNTCGAACWYAKEKACHCSCGGRNHGCLLDPDGEQPERVVKIDGDRYRLEAVGAYNFINNLAHAINLRLGWRRIETTITNGDGTPYHYAHHAIDKGAATRVKTPAGNQKDWPEMRVEHTKFPYILWVKVDLPDPVWCDDTNCHRCIDRKFEIWAQEEK